MAKPGTGFQACSHLDLVEASWKMSHTHIGAESEMDEDGLPRGVVGAWAQQKHERLIRYIGISSGVRSKFLGPRKAGATFIDLFCGTGRARIEGASNVIPGSPIAAWEQSVTCGTPFSKIYIADAEVEFVDAASKRLRTIGAPVEWEVGCASETVNWVIRNLDPYGLHVAFLDPFNLSALSFDIIEKLAAFKRMDIVVHISGMDMRRNLGRYIKPGPTALDEFAPGWRNSVVVASDIRRIRAGILAHWRKLVIELGMNTTETHEQVTGRQNQLLYWLAFAAKHDRAMEFWQKIRNVSQQGELQFG